MLPLLFEEIESMAADVHAVDVLAGRCSALFLYGHLVLVANVDNGIKVTAWKAPYDAPHAGTSWFTTGGKDCPGLDGSCKGEKRAKAAKKGSVQK
jgi:hypothetical protein